MKSHIIEKRKKYLGNKSIVMGSFSYLDKKFDENCRFYVRDFNDKTIFIIPGVSADYDKSFIVANYIYECFEQQNTNKGFEAFKDCFDCSAEDEKLVSRIFNQELFLDDICYINGSE